MKIREKNKKIYRDKILAASREVFTSQGFENTTIEQIAKKAGIGTGTAYNYFKSKEELFILSMADDVEAEIQFNLEEFTDNGSNVSEIVTESILKQIKNMNWINKKIWKIAFPVILNSLKSDKIPVKEIMRADLKIMDKTKELIVQLKEKKMLSAEFNTDTAIDLIFGAIFLQFSMYIYTDDATFEEICEKIRMDIQFVFNDK